MPDTDNTHNNQSVQSGRPKKALSTEQQQKQQRILIVLILIIVVGAVFILYRNGVIGGSSSKAPVERYLQAIAAKDFDSYVDTMPQKMADDYRKERSERGLSGEEYMAQLYSDYFNEFGNDMRVELEFTDRSRPDNRYVENFKSSYAYLYGEDIRISSVFEIDVAAYFSGSKSSDIINLECYVIKSGGKWYIVGCDYQTADAEED